MRCPHCNHALGNDLDDLDFTYDRTEHWTREIHEIYTVICPKCDEPLVWCEVYKLKHIEIAPR